jgi:hypothetical protein
VMHLQRYFEMDATELLMRDELTALENGGYLWSKTFLVAIA